MKRERGKYNILHSLKKKKKKRRWLAFFDYFNRIFDLIFLQLF